MEWRTGPKNAIQFIKAVSSKYEALKSLATSVPRRVDLSQLSRPRALLTALKQHTARELGYPLETLQICANWIENRSDKKWKVSLELEGLLISGRFVIHYWNLFNLSFPNFLWQNKTNTRTDIFFYLWLTVYTVIQCLIYRSFDWGRCLERPECKFGGGCGRPNMPSGVYARRIFGR